MNCRAEAPAVAEAYQQYGDDVTFVGVAGRDEVGPMQDVVAEFGLEGFDHVIDADGSLWAAFGVPGQPAWALLDDDGTSEVRIGSLSADELASRLEKLTVG